MAVTRQEAVEQILEGLGTGIERTALALACLGAAYETLTTAPADRLEAELYGPVQRAYGRGMRAYSHYAKQNDVPARTFTLPDAGVASQGARAFIDRAVVATANADRALSDLQDTSIWIEFGDSELRAGLAAMRELLTPLPVSAREFVRTLGR